MSDPRLEGLSPAKRKLLLERLRQKAGERESQAVPPLTPVPRPPAGMPLSFGQQQLWVIEQLAPGSPLYNVPAHIVLDGELDREALAASLAGVVERHEALRTRFVRIDGQPRQVVAPVPPPDLPLVDLMGLPDARCEALRLAADESGRPFDLERGPLLRATLLRLAPQRHVLLLNLHHIASDGWSIGVLQREVAALYEAHRTGRPAALPELPVQYADFAWHQRHLLGGLEGERLEALLGYWRERLADPPPPLPLPLDRPRPAVRSQEGRSVAIGPETFSPGFAAALTRLGEPRGATLFTVLLAAFQTLLSRITGQTDVVLGTPVANRERPEVEGLIGYFVNTLVLRTDLAGDPSFLELLERTRETAVGAFAHQALPLERLVEEVKPERDLSLTPLFQVAFALQNAPVSSLSLPGLTLSMLAGEGGAPAKFDLTLLAVEEEGSLALSFDFAAALFDTPTAQRLLGGYATLLQGIAVDPDRPLSSLPLLSAAELHQLEVEWNDTATRVDFPMVHQAIAELARRTPDAPAVYDRQAGPEPLTYGEWNVRAERLRGLLRSRGVGVEDRVAICLERSALALTAMLGVLKAGAAYVPLDPAHPDERLSFMVEDSGAKVLLTRRSLLDARPALGAGTEPICIDEIGEIGEADFTGEDVPVTPEDLCYVIYTSGSTGKPKGVGIEHRSLSNYIAWQQRWFGITATDRATHLAGQGFDATIIELWPALTAGAAVEVVEEEIRLSPADLLARLAASAITLCMLPTPLAELVLAEIEKQPALADTLALRVLGIGGDRLNRVPALPLPFRILNLYGPTEGTVAATALEVEPADGAPPIGRPLDNLRVHLLDGRLQPVPLGVAGEICIGGLGIARGYLGRPRQTAAVFLPDPWSPVPGARLYLTGDRARHLPDGRIEFLGRVDRQVKVRGFRLEPGEIEAVLADHPEVRTCAVLVREDRPGDRRLVAYVETSAEVEALAVWLRGKLPGYMVPSAFVALGSLPLTANGKVDRQALLRIRPETPPAAPAALRTDAEEAVAAVWREVLQRPDVGPDDNFFDLGGHSLLLVQVHERLRERFPQVQVLDLFRHPTVASLAVHLAPVEEARPTAALARREAVGGYGDVAVIGMSGRFPGAADVEALWPNLLQGVEAVRFLSDDELARAGVAPDVAASPSYVRALAACEGTDLFDAGFFGFTPREAEATDPQHRLFLECAWEALESAGYDPASYRGRIGVYGGAGLSGYQWNLYSNQDVVQSLGALQAKVAIDKDFLATRVSYKLGLTGPSFTVQTACSTSLVAVHLACRALLDGECDMALAGGVSLQTGGGGGYFYEEGGILSPDGHCCAFDAAARGTVPGEGVGVVLLKRLADAMADGDPIDAVIKGSAINNDGSQKVGYTAPGIDGQAEVLRAALAASGVDPRTVTYVEAHGTATPLGDPIEVAALTQVFGGMEGRSQRCALGSIKTNIGHLDCAAGVAGLIKTALALRHGVIPPSLHFERPNPQIDFDAGPFYVNTAATPWRVEDGPRRAGVSSFGIGGTNAHAVLEEAPAVETSASPDAWHLLVLSARSEEALERATVDLAAHLERHPDLDPADVAHTLQVGRRAFDHRRTVLCRGLDDAREALTARDPRRVLTGRRSGGGAVAFLFPGQGAQKTGMGRDLYRAWPSFRTEVDRAAEVLCPHLGLDLRDLLFPPPERRAEAEALLVETRYTQPALFVVEHALARLWMSWGLQPWAFLGHSAGEYVAACLAGVFSLEDALELVALRGKLIQALPPGAMLSVPMSAEETLPLLTSELSLAAVNAVDRSVVSGPAPAIDDLRRRLSQRGFEGRTLATSHAFHSPMMDPAVDVLARTVARIHPQPPRIPYLSNVTGTWIRPEEATDPAYWGRHLRETVRFADGLRELLPRTGVLLEVGPGETLARLARRELRAGLRGGQSGTPVISSLPATDEGEEAAMLRAAGRLWLHGTGPDWEALRPGERRRRVHLPTYPFERRRYWLDPKPVQAAAAGPEPQRSFAKDPDPASWFYLSTWERSLPPGRDAELPDGSFLVVLDDTGLGDALAARLRALGRDVTTAREGDDYDAVLRSRLPSVILHLGNFGPPQPLDTALERGFYGPLSLAQALGRLGATDPIDLWLVSSHLHDVSGGEPVQPERSLLLGPSRVIPLEMPHVTCRNLDLDTARVDRLLAEVAARPAETVIAWRGRQRWVQSFEPVRLAAGKDRAPRLRQGGVYLITGGLGGVGHAIAKWLARTVSARLLLMGRTALPPREEWDAIPGHEALGRRIRRLRELEEAGAEVLVVQGDVSDPAHLAWARELAVERWGAVHGVIHAAGVPGGGVIQRKDRAAAAAVLAPKVQGTLALASVFPPEDLDLFVLCSSLNSVIGAFGQADYCAANAFLDAFAAARSRDGEGITVSIAWDLWEEAGMALETERTRGLRLLSGAPIAHPLLDARVQAPPGEEVYLTRLSAASHWVLDEHRIQGVPVLPGTAYLELVRAAFEQSTGNPTAEIQATFLAPLAIPDGETLDVYTVLHRQGERWSFRVASRAGGWQEHAIGEVGPLTSGSPEAVLPDLPLEPVLAEESQEPAVMRFGPRWNNLRKVGASGDLFLALLDLPAEFAPDLPALALHPALLDLATGFARALDRSVEGFYLPFSYAGLRVRRPLTPTLYSAIRRKEGAGETLRLRYQVTLFDPEGEALAEIDEFAFRRIDPAAAAPARAAGETIPLSSGQGLSSAEGVEALRRVLAADLPQVLVSVRDLQTRLQEAAGLTGERILAELNRLEEAAPAGPRHARPDLGSAYTPPRTETERWLAEIWSDLLGIDPVGIHDDFFELGGDSVLSLRIVARAREKGLTLAPGLLFQKPTIAALAAELESGAPSAPQAEVAAEPARPEPESYKPADFPDAEVSQRDLEALLSQLGGLGGTG